MSQPDMSPSWAANLDKIQSARGAANGASGGNVRAAIARAAGATGVDFSYLAAQARLESGLNPAARNGASSASGLYQFTNSTWLQTLQKHGDMLGLGNTGAAMADPAQRMALLGLRGDPHASAMMAASLASDNADALTAVLGRAPDASELYVAHFLGADGAAKFLSALGSSPDQPAAGLLPKAASANRSIFYDDAGNPRSVAAVMGLIRGRMESALAAEGISADAMMASGAAYGGEGMGVGGMAWAMPSDPAATAVASAPPQTGGPLSREFNAMQAAVPAASPHSMADTLQSAFGLGAENGATPEFVRNAYGRLRALGM
ncbi:transglycosylase SLT domain-containing protein [Novosphingobium humi]|uniref:transglycosylase SLT domain-containing protein n=1 Tax=Novosphingobium humi TaxID=2282397 RepID=UPI0025B05E77|nr:transglycosylase SLT domain-containing protein [Novosphingobium humi]WJS99600.1 transglycosylase SLT domain-containing protein [Novosphingobium humi]